jgi:hypothetical protein
MPPSFGTFGDFSANAIIINLTDEKHWQSATLGNVISLNPKWHTIKLTFILSSLADDLDCILVMLKLTEH